MNAEPEGRVAIVLPVDDDSIRIGECMRIAVGSRKRQHDELAGAHGAAAHLYVVHHLPRHCDR